MNQFNRFTTASEFLSRRDTPEESELTNTQVKSAIKQNRLDLEDKINRFANFAIGTVGLLFLGLVVVIAIAVIALIRVNTLTAMLQSQDASMLPISTRVDFSFSLDALRKQPELPAIPMPENVLMPDQILDLLIENYEGKLNFNFQIVEEKNKSGYTHGRSTCGPSGFIYFYETPGFQRDLERGIWITVTDCGLEGDKVADAVYTEDFARIYMPYEAMDRVVTFKDYIEAIRAYGVLYEVNQDALVMLLNVDIEKLPLNKWLPLPPVPVRDSN